MISSVTVTASSSSRRTPNRKSATCLPSSGWSWTATRMTTSSARASRIASLSQSSSARLYASLRAIAVATIAQAVEPT
jgi:hypothetical protein